MADHYKSGKQRGSRVAEFINGLNKKRLGSWRELYEQFYTPLSIYSYKITNDSLASEDIVQDILVKLWYSKINFEDFSKLKSYLYKSVYTRSLNFNRDRRRAGVTSQENLAVELATEDNYIKMAAEEDALNQFYKTLEQLPLQQRKIIILALNGDKNDEIAEKLGVSVNTIKTQKRRAYSFIRENLGTSLFFVLLCLLSGSPGLTRGLMRLF